MKKHLCPNCGYNSFYGFQRLIVEILIDEDGNHKYSHGGELNDCVEEWLEVKGPYKCTKCHHEYNELPIIEEK